MATTVITIEDEIQIALNDFATGLGQEPQWLTRQLLRGFIFERMATTEGTYTLQKLTTGVYKDQSFPASYALWFSDQTTPFAAETTETYDIWAKGLKAYVKTGTRTATSISVTGTVVHFDRVMADIFWYLANHRSKEVAQQIGGNDYSPDAAYRACIAQHEYWKGVTVSAN